MSKHQRYISARFDEVRKEEIKRNDAGFVRLPVIATRTGVLNYRREDGQVVREARLPEEVFAKDSIESMKGIPATNEHPKGLVDSMNAKRVAVGFTADQIEKVDEKFLKTFVTVIDEDAIQDIVEGKREVSMGYQIERDETPGTFDGEEYDVVQRGIRYNHLAIVTKGRAGPEVRLRLDSKNNEIDGYKEDICMPKIKIADKEFEVAKEVADEFKAMGDKLKMKNKKDSEDVELKETLEKTISEKDETQAKLDVATETITKLEKEKETTLDSKQVEKIARERTRVVRVAETVLDEETQAKLDDMDTKEIKAEVVKADSSDEKFSLEGKSEAYIDARFDVVAENSAKSNTDETAKLGKKVDESRKDNADDEADLEKTKTKQREDAEKSWQQPLALVK